ncbi:DUF4326 domain-containing protein [Streptomyces sp. NPDC051636]|uniref:DUF4326 domain-containing protein n=1 Tax=Streptomyces sp. NPDC051636 TaxID=3365663 RepID=UPI0037B41322
MTTRQLALDTQPRRLQRKRTKGWRAPADAKYVGRGTPWGNPYAIKQCGPTHAVIDTRTNGVIFGSKDQTEAHRVAVTWYRAWLTSQPDLHAAARQQLAGRDLLCWCPPELSCHADVLLELANHPAA